MPARIHAVHPVLMSSDVTASLQFFARLGFRESFRDRPREPRYAAVQRDGVELHLQWHDAAQWEHASDRPTYRLLVSDVDQLYVELGGAGVLEAGAAGESPWRQPAETPWGTREFHVRDLDGNGLHFYQPAG